MLRWMRMIVAMVGVTLTLVTGASAQESSENSGECPQSRLPQPVEGSVPAFVPKTWTSRCGKGIERLSRSKRSFTSRVMSQCTSH